MNREAAGTALRKLAIGLDPDLAGVRRLLERIAASDEPEALRALLAEAGAAAVLSAVAAEGEGRE